MSRKLGHSANKCATAVWPKSVLDKHGSKGDLEAAMVAIQKQDESPINSVWRGKTRINVANAVAEQHKRALRTLYGKFLNIAAVGDTPIKDGTRRLLNLPEEWSGMLSDTDVASLAKLASGMNMVDVLKLFRKVRNGKATGLPLLHAQALAAMLDMTETQSHLQRAMAR